MYDDVTTKYLPTEYPMGSNIIEAMDIKFQSVISHVL